MNSRSRICGGRRDDREAVLIPLSLIEQVHGFSGTLRDHLAELGLYDQDADACTDPRVAWALMYPSMQAAGLFAEITGAAVTGEDQ